MMVVNPSALQATTLQVHLWLLSMLLLSTLPMSTAQMPTLQHGRRAVPMCPANSANISGVCKCNQGFASTANTTTNILTLTSDVWGTCTHAACPANSSLLEPNPPAFNCTCNVGYKGSINATSVMPFFTGACVLQPCSVNNSGTGPNCSCTRGYFGTVDWQTSNKSWTSTTGCKLSTCPPNSGIGPNCTCASGYSGEVLYSSLSQSWTGSCSLVNCPINTINGSAPNCQCMPGYSDSLQNLRFDSILRTWMNNCTAVACPTNATAAPLALCECILGYVTVQNSSIRTLPYSISLRAYTDNCTQVRCPGNSSGLNVLSGCTCDTYFNGTISLSIKAPFYTNSCTALQPIPWKCEPGFFHTSGEKGTLNAMRPTAPFEYTKMSNITLDANAIGFNNKQSGTGFLYYATSSIDFWLIGGPPTYVPKKLSIPVNASGVAMQPMANGGKMFIADFDEETGLYHVLGDSTGKPWYAINITLDPPVYTLKTVTGSVTMGADMVYVNGKFYTLSGNKLSVIDAKTFVSSRYTVIYNSTMGLDCCPYDPITRMNVCNSAPTSTDGTFGAAFSDKYASLYFGRNKDNTIWQIVNKSGTLFASCILDAGEAVSSNDGASCKSAGSLLVPPTLRNSTILVYKNTSITVALLEFEPDCVACSVTRNSTVGMLGSLAGLSSDGIVTYTPLTNMLGVDKFTVGGQDRFGRLYFDKYVLFTVVEPPACGSGFTPRVFTHSTSPFITTMCGAVGCRDGRETPFGCACTVGPAPFFTSTCVLSPCPGNASGSPYCTCNSGFTGGLTFSESTWRGTCNPAFCPAHADISSLSTTLIRTAMTRIDAFNSCGQLGGSLAHLTYGNMASYSSVLGFGEAWIGSFNGITYNDTCVKLTQSNVTVTNCTALLFVFCDDVVSDTYTTGLNSRTSFSHLACNCNSGYFGVLSQHSTTFKWGGECSNIDDCSPNPCTNNAFCSDLVNSYSCACLMGEWSAYTSCSAVCDQGTQNRSRNIIVGPINDGLTCSSSFEVRSCIVQNCTTTTTTTTPIILTCNATQVLNSNKESIGSIVGSTGQAVNVSCNAGYHGSGRAVCLESGIFSSVTCSPNPCISSQVGYSDWAFNGSITGTTNAVIFVTCNAGYSGSGIVTCQASGTFSTLTCSEDNECLVHPCENGATCNDLVNAFDCVCAAGYSGTTCSIDIDDCSPSPCANNAVCSDQVNAFFCTCTAGYSGVTCNIALPCRATQVMNSDKSSIGSIVGTTGQAVSVGCNAGFPGSGSAVCLGSGIFTTVTCSASACASSQVAHSDFSVAGSITGSTNVAVIVTCDAGYSGSGAVTCQPSGVFSTVTCSENNECLVYTPCENGATCNDLVNEYSCSCSAGYSGKNCSTNIDECSPVPCKFGSTCTDLVNEFSCACVAGYSGATCSVASQCSATQVLHSNKAVVGIIVGTTGQTVPIACNAGYSGSGSAVCLGSGIFSTVACIANPCISSQVGHSDWAENGSITGTTNAVIFVTCNAGYSGSGIVTCQASGTFSTLTCSEDNECLAHPCENGATCNDLVNAFDCVCVAGYSGTTCSIDIDDCSPSPCANNAVCSDQVNSFFCTCTAGYSGVTCDLALSCSATQVMNSNKALIGSVAGTTGNSVFVTCIAGYSGSGSAVCLGSGIFSTVTCVANPCVSSQVSHSDWAVVRSITGSMGDLAMVTCDTGYSGSGNVICQSNGTFSTVTCHDVDECLLSPCQNDAICSNLINAYACTCVAGYSGTNCSTNINECQSNPCQNGAVCNDLLNAYTCTCIAGYSGTNCATNVNECMSNPCQNGASCNDLLNSYSCTCLPGYTGSNCATNVDNCLPNQCRNGATCTDLVDDYSCTCAAGYSGTICSTNVDECSPNPCLNGGFCRDFVSRYSCSCVRGFTGATCTIPPTPAPTPVPRNNYLSPRPPPPTPTVALNLSGSSKDEDASISASSSIIPAIAGAGAGLLLLLLILMYKLKKKLNKKIKVHPPSSSEPLPSIEDGSQTERFRVGDNQLSQADMMALSLERTNMKNLMDQKSKFSSDRTPKTFLERKFAAEKAAKFLQSSEAMVQKSHLNEGVAKSNIDHPRKQEQERLNAQQDTLITKTFRPGMEPINQRARGTSMANQQVFRPQSWAGQLNETNFGRQGDKPAIIPLTTVTSGPRRTSAAGMKIFASDEYLSVSHNPRRDTAASATRAIPFQSAPALNMIRGTQGRFSSGNLGPLTIDSLSPRGSLFLPREPHMVPSASSSSSGVTRDPLPEISQGRKPRRSSVAIDFAMAQRELAQVQRRRSNEFSFA